MFHAFFFVFQQADKSKRVMLVISLSGVKVCSSNGEVTLSSFYIQQQSCFLLQEEDFVEIPVGIIQPKYLFHEGIFQCEIFLLIACSYILQWEILNYLPQQTLFYIFLPNLIKISCYCFHFEVVNLYMLNKIMKYVFYRIKKKTFCMHTIYIYLH